MKIVILCGGKGTRLGLGDVPKPMVLLDAKPLLERLVNQAAEQGFDDFLFLAGHGAEFISRHFGDGRLWGVRIEHVVERDPLGSAGSFLQVRDRLDAPFIVLYGDVLHDIDLVAFCKFGAARGGAGTLFVHPNDHPEDSDLVEVDENDRIVAFHAKPHAPTARLPNLVSAALYYLTPRALEGIPHGYASDWGRDVFPTLTKTAPLFAYRSCEYAKDVGTPARLAVAQRHLREGRLERLSRRSAKPVVFLDRDGVINEDCGGVITLRQVTLIPGAAAGVRRLNDQGFPIICATNQPFLAKGQLDWAEMRAISGEIDCQLAEAAGAFLDDVRICPHHPECGWEGEVTALKIDCDCRKPKPGLILNAAIFHNIDLPMSWFVGDRYCDIAAGRAAGTRTILVETGAGGSDGYSYDIEPDYIVTDLCAAVDLILECTA